MMTHQRHLGGISFFEFSDVHLALPPLTLGMALLFSTKRSDEKCNEIIINSTYVWKSDTISLTLSHFCNECFQVVGHQVVLGIASPILRSLFLTSSPFDDIIHVSLPEVSHIHLSNFIESIYVGSVPTVDDAFEGWKYMVRGCS